MLASFCQVTRNLMLIIFLHEISADQHNVFPFKVPATPTSTNMFKEDAFISRPKIPRDISSIPVESTPLVPKVSQLSLNQTPISHTGVENNTITTSTKEILDTQV